jgi:alcohol dehydrogenase (NADP+)
MESFVEKGYTRYIGISNFDRAQVQALLKDAKIKPYAHQFETHPYLQQQDFVDFHKELGIKVIAYAPLANLNPFYDRGLESILKDPFWREIAEKKNATVPQVVLAWGLQRGTIVIPRTVKESHISENLGAVNINFTEEELKTVGEEDKKVRMSNPSKSWGVQLFGDLDDHEVSDDGFDEL